MASDNVDMGIAMLVGVAFGDGSTQPISILATFETPSGSFVGRIDDPVSIDRAREALDQATSAWIPHSRIVKGDGGRQHPPQLASP